MAERTLVNETRPPVFCPGCSHDRALKVLDEAFINMGLTGNDVAMVSDIGCSGLFDTFFDTHALHGLHGRALTYAAGLKLCRPELTVVVTMGDGGLGIGGAHFLAACRRNLDLTLLILNNFNFGMTGGQYSSTTPVDAEVGSGFLNRLDRPLDVYRVASAAGAPFVAVCSAYQNDLSLVIESAIRFQGMSIVEIQGLCPGRFTRKNRLTPQIIAENLSERGSEPTIIEANLRPEYGEAYHREAEALPPVTRPVSVSVTCNPPEIGHRSIIVLGSAGQRIITAGEIIGLAGLAAGLNVTQKNEYDITVLRGPSITELNLSPDPIEYTGIETPDVILALAREGVRRKRTLFGRLRSDSLVIAAEDVMIPDTPATVHHMEFKAMGVKSQDRALAGLAILAGFNRIINMDMLRAGLHERFRGLALKASLELVGRLGGLTPN